MQQPVSLHAIHGSRIIAEVDVYPIVLRSCLYSMLILGISNRTSSHYDAPDFLKPISSFLAT